MTRGNLLVNGQALKQGDGAAVSGVERLEITSDREGEYLAFDLA